MIIAVDCKFKILKYFLLVHFIHLCNKYKLTASHKEYKNQSDMVSGFEKP